MRLFHPVFNADGQISLFRVGCLIVALMSFIAAAVLKMQGGEESAAAEVLGQERTRHGFSLFDSGPSLEEVILSKRQLALSELEECAEFFTACGVLNVGFEGCTFSFSDEVLEAFIPSVDAADDGFAVTLRAKGAQRSDLCVELAVSSQSEVTGFNAEGREMSECALSSHAKSSLELYRRTDSLEGNPAPSGRAKVVTAVADRKAKTREEERI